MIARRRLRRLAGLTSAEWRCLLLACGAHVVCRVLLHVMPLRRVLRLTNLGIPVARRPLPLSRVTELTSWSRPLCRGTCLSETIVLAVLARRHGFEVPVSIGVSTADGVFQAHAWSGDAEQAPFERVWSSRAER